MLHAGRRAPGIKLHMSRQHSRHPDRQVAGFIRLGRGNRAGGLDLVFSTSCNLTDPVDLDQKYCHALMQKGSNGLVEAGRINPGF
jgi:hypothetical protein